ncbi:GatB/Yqey domain superfamily [Salinibacter ruber DSM 13855]|uniref:GatB/Yqey domain superfamily n=3 Tax=Salinibacter ruber TaxID=146919 RepID=Q2S1E8_SALRD|nr:GatB/Yqey domain superfamily [Salinibacter ruber DSM 13855]
MFPARHCPSLSPPPRHSQPHIMSDSILDRVKQDLTDAMKAQDDVRRRALRSLRAALANKEIAKRRAGADSSLEGQEELAVVQKQVKQRRDSIEQYEEADRDDLAQKEREEIEVLEDYLPDRLSDEELAERLDAIIDDVGATSMADMGPVMGRAMDELRGRVDGNRVREMVQDRLSD